MKLKLFVDSRAGKIEEQVNHWFSHEAGPVYVVKTDTAVAAARPIRPLNPALS
jgi:hypothetical protein